MKTTSDKVIRLYKPAEVQIAREMAERGIGTVGTCFGSLHLILTTDQANQVSSVCTDAAKFYKSIGKRALKDAATYIAEQSWQIAIRS